jgi:ectoine hydroxylase-related dioxygenase (phytanoyl-CoA dioxygenase family)
VSAGRETLDRSANEPHKRLRPFLPQVDTRSATVASFARHQIFRRLTREMIGPDVDQAWNQACIKLPDEGDLTVFPFHQDSKFAKLNDMESGLSCFVGLGALSVENGTLHFAAQGHKHVLEHQWNAAASWWECVVDGFEIVPGVLRPGQMVIYHPMTPHGSPANRTSAPREALLLGFARPGIRLVETNELFGDQRPLLRGGAPCWEVDEPRGSQMWA